MVQEATKTMGHKGSKREVQVMEDVASTNRAITSEVSEEAP